MKAIYFFITFLLLYTNLYAQKPEAIKEYNAGLEYYNLKNYIGAIPFFEQAIKKDPTFVYAYRTLISCNEQLGDLETVANLYERVIELAPSDKTLCYNLALTYIDLKDYNKSVLYLKKALQIDATYTKAADRLEEVESYLRKQKEKQGGQEYQSVEVEYNDLEKKIYNEALVLYRKEKYNEALNKLNTFQGEVLMPDFYYLKAITLQHLGKRQEAIESYEEALAVDDRHFNSNLNLGRIYYNDGNYQESVPLLETAYERRKNDMNLLFSLAKAHYYAKDFSEAVETFEVYTKRNSSDSEAWLLLGKSYTQLNKSRSASKAFDQAKKCGVRNDDLFDDIQNEVAKYGKKASELAQEGYYQEAIDVLEKAIEEHSKEASLHFNLGLNYMEIGNHKKAREEFSKTIDLDASHAKAYQGLGLIYYEKGEYSKAAAYYQATVDAGKHDKFVYYKLGSSYYRLKRMQQAIEAYKEAVKRDPKEKRFHFGLGLAYLGVKENYKSIECFETALKLDNMYLDAQYHLCVNYIEINDYDKCITEAEKILTKNSNYAKAYLVIGHAHKRMGNYVLAEEYQAKAVRLDPTLRQ